MNGIRTRSALIGAASLVLVLGLAAAAGASPRQTAKEGGTLVVGMAAGEPDVLDPTLARTFSGREVFLTFCEKLYDLNSKAQIVPQLATALPTVSADKLTLTIPLRKGVLFNDGTPFNADAVVTTLNRDLTLKGSTRASEISPISSVEAQGASTVVIHLKNPYSPLTAQLADRAGMIMSPTAADEARGELRHSDRSASARSCTRAASPATASRWSSRRTTTTRRTSTSTRSSSRSRTTPPPAAAALKAGDLQVLDQIDPTQLPGINSTKSLRVIKETGLGYQGLTLNLGNKNGLLKLPYTNVGTQHRVELAAARGVRDGDRPQDDEQGRLRRHRAARLHAALSVERVLRPEHQVHAPTTRPRRRSSSSSPASRRRRST